MDVLLLGCGHSKAIRQPTAGVDYESASVVTLDNDSTAFPDVYHDLNITELPFLDNTFDEVHAYEVLEHTGKQGDFKFFFKQFEGIWNVLKESGVFTFSVPSPESTWVFGDPGHTRIIHPNSIVFLIQKCYDQVGITSMTDYRSIYHADWEVIRMDIEEESFICSLKAIK